MGSSLERCGHDRAQGEECDDDPIRNDRNGSAKIALISIERSESAWQTIAEATGTLPRPSLPRRWGHSAAKWKALSFARLFKRPGFGDLDSWVPSLGRHSAQVRSHQRFHIPAWCPRPGSCPRLYAAAIVRHLSTTSGWEFNLSEFTNFVRRGRVVQPLKTKPSPLSFPWPERGRWFQARD